MQFANFLQHRQGLKRKFEDPLEFDENGNWTLETARAKLQDFFAINGKELSFDEKEVGTLQDRHYQVIHVRYVIKYIFIFSSRSQ